MKINICKKCVRYYLFLLYGVIKCNYCFLIELLNNIRKQNLGKGKQNCNSGQQKNRRQEDIKRSLLKTVFILKKKIKTSNHSLSLRNNELKMLSD